MGFYTTRSLVVAAKQFWPERTWPDGVYAGPETMREFSSLMMGGRTGGYFLETPMGTAVLEAGDWVVVGPKGERYVFKPDIFSVLYEAV